MTDTSAARPPGTIVFVHVPKTAGSTLNVVARRLFPGRVARVNPNWRDDPSGEDLRERFRSAAAERPVMIAGHFPYGVHRWVEEPCRYATVLRDPVDRVVSAYSSFERKPHLEQHERVRALAGGIETAVTEGSFEVLENLQTRLLAGFPDPDRPVRPEGPCTDEMLTRAKANLSRLDGLLLTERFDEGLILLRRTFGWPMPLYRRRNRTRGRPRSDRLDGEVRDLIEDRNRFDRELFEFGRELFESRWEAAGPSAVRDLRRLRFYNVPYQPAWAAWERWLRPLRNRLREAVLRLRR